MDNPIRGLTPPARPNPIYRRLTGWEVGITGVL